MDKKLKLDIYKKIVLSRRLEERIAELIKAGKGGGFMHPGVGQERLQVGAIATLRPDDYLLDAHRGVAYWVARGIPLEKGLCELARRDRGTNHGKTIDGKDVEQVFDAITEAVKHARSGHGPSLVEAKTYRLWGHWIGDPDSYRSREEVEKHWRRDPLPVYERKLLDEKVLVESARAEIDADARAQIDRAIAFMEKHPFPPPDTALEALYA